MTKNKLFQLFFPVFGLIIMCAGLFLAGMGMSEYIEKYHQTDWPTAEAVVSDISSRVERRELQGTVTVYDITYQYEVDGECYIGQLRGAMNIRMVGDAIKIKYDSANPARSTAVLKLQLSELLFPVGAGVILLVVGYFLTGIHARIRKLRGKKNVEDAYIGETAIERYSQRKNLWLRMLLPLGMFVITGLFVVIMNRFFSPTKMIGTERFTEAMTINGYNTSDTTDELRQEWKIGSLLKESCSVQNQNIRIDFCVMDSSGSAKRLYKAMRLLGSDGDEDNNVLRMEMVPLLFEKNQKSVFLYCRGVVP